MSCEALRFLPGGVHSELNWGGKLNELVGATYPPIRSQKQTRGAFCSSIIKIELTQLYYIHFSIYKIDF